MEKTKEKRSFQAPHTFVILVVLILIAVAATYVVPAGEYTRYADEATGRTLVEAGSFHYVESAPVSFFSIPSLIYRAIVKAASTVTFILIIGGSFEIITSTGVLTVLCKKMSKAFKGREFFVYPGFSGTVFHFWRNHGNVNGSYDLCTDRNCSGHFTGTG